MISFVIPAHNEERLLPQTLSALLAAAERIGRPYEVIVVNDASTDRTREIALERGIRVIDVRHRQIAATRNSGARAARGDILFFIDADTQANVGAIRAGLEAIERGAVGGGCLFRYDGWIPWWARILLPIGSGRGPRGEGDRRRVPVLPPGRLRGGGRVQRAVLRRRGVGVRHGPQAARPVSSSRGRRC